MRYRAYWIIGGREIRVFPHSKKTSLFKSVSKAERRLEVVAKRVNKDTRGIVRDCNDNIVLTIAL